MLYMNLWNSIWKYVALAYVRGFWLSQSDTGKAAAAPHPHIHPVPTTYSAFRHTPIANHTDRRRPKNTRSMQYEGKHKLHQHPGPAPLSGWPRWKRFSTEYIHRYIIYPSSNWPQICSIASFWIIIYLHKEVCLWSGLDSLLLPAVKPHSL